MAAKPLAVTQMSIFPIRSSCKLDDLSSKEGRVWSELLNLAEQQPGFLRLYWGRSVEKRDRVHLHIGIAS